MKTRYLSFCLALVGLLLVAGCSKSQPSASDSAAAIQPASASAAVTAASATSTAATQAAVPAPNIDGQRVLQYTKDVVAFGSRPAGSPAHEKLEQYILSKLKGVDVEQDKFTAQTPAGKFPINNIIAKFPGKKNGIIVVAGHYDTNYPLPKTYVGANDGGSSTALLLALADQFRGHERDGYSVWLV